MSKYAVNTNQAIEELLPPDKRMPNTRTFVQSLLSGIDWAKNFLFTTYYLGAQYPTYNATYGLNGTYNIYDIVNYDGKVYMNLVDKNPADPFTSGWTLLQNDTIGIRERVNFNGSTIVLEYALNEQFGGTFSPLAELSSIYISNQAAVLNGFHVGVSNAGSSLIGTKYDIGISDYIGNSYPFVYLPAFIVYVPRTLLDVSLPDHVNNLNMIQSFINKYIPASLTYQIQNY